MLMPVSTRTIDSITAQATPMDSWGAPAEYAFGLGMMFAYYLPLEGLSRRSYNVVGVYEKYDWSVRLAWNWRSRYLLTASEANLRLPMWADDTGQLDASIFYNHNKNVQLGIQANNLTDTVTKVLMGPRYYADADYLDETLYTRAYFMNDRRYSLVLRARF